MPIQINLFPETERILRAKAVAAGRTLEAFLEELANREAAILDKEHRQVSSDLTEFEHGLDELWEGLPPLQSLPSDFSRADIYGDHPEHNRLRTLSGDCGSSSWGRALIIR